MKWIARSRIGSNWMVTLFCFIALAGLSACQPGTTPSPAVPPVVTADILPPPTKAPPMPACVDMEGVNLDVQTSADGELRLVVSGLDPAEKATVVFYAESEGRTFRIESSAVASAEGRAEYVENLGKVAGGFFKTWQVQVAHARGVACAAINLP